MSNDDFTTDPLFSPLRTFAAQGESPDMSSTIRNAFREGLKSKRRRTLLFRGLFGAGLIAIAFPTLSAAKLLPSPVQHMVDRVNKTLTAPIHGLFGKNDTAADPTAAPTPDPSLADPVDPEDAAELTNSSTSSRSTDSTADGDDERQVTTQPFQNGDGSVSYPDGDGNYDDADIQAVSTQPASDDEAAPAAGASDNSSDNSSDKEDH